MSDTKSLSTIASSPLLAGGVMLVVMVLAATAIARLRDSAPNGSLTVPVVAIGVDPTSPDRSEFLSVESASLADQLVGVWTLNRHGERLLTIRADGTAVADVRLDWMGALVYGEHLQLNLSWQLDGEVMSQTIESGTPEAAVGRLTRDWGDHRKYRIVEVTSDKLVMVEIGDEDDRQEWSAVVDSASEQ